MSQMTHHHVFGSRIIRFMVSRGQHQNSCQPMISCDLLSASKMVRFHTLKRFKASKFQFHQNISFQFSPKIDVFLSEMAIFESKIAFFEARVLGSKINLGIAFWQCQIKLSCLYFNRASARRLEWITKIKKIKLRMKIFPKNIQFRRLIQHNQDEIRFSI